LNAEHIKNTDDRILLPHLKAEMDKAGYISSSFSEDYLLKVISAMKSRLTFYNDFIERSSYFFEPPKEYDKSIIEKRWNEETPAHISVLIEEFKELNSETHDDFEAALKKVAGKLEIGPGKLIHPVRLAVSGIGVGPGVFELLAILGKDEVINRINKAIEKIK
jgi:glutamyl-tRNA synthetase